MIHLSWLSKLTISKVDTRKECTHCNKRGHIREKCRFLLLYCTHCNKGGHIREECRLLHGKPPNNNDRPRHTTNMTQNKNDILSIPNAKDGSSQSVTSTAPLEQTIMTTFSTKHQGNNYQPLLLLLLISY